MIPFAQIVRAVDKNLLLLVGQCIEFIIFVMFSIIMLWLYTPYGLVVKGIITILIGIVTYDVFRHFVYVKWVLYKETMINNLVHTLMTANLGEEENEDQI